MGKALARQGIGYVLVGGVAFVVDFAVFLLVLPMWGTVGAQTAARVAGALVGFVGHKFFAFGDRRREPGRMLRQGAAYAGLWLGSWTLSTGGIVALVRVFSLPPAHAKLAVEPVIVVINFLVMRRLFAQPRGEA